MLTSASWDPNSTSSCDKDRSSIQLIQFKHEDHPRHLYRQGSLTSTLAEELGLSLDDNGVARSRSSVSSRSTGGVRTRTPSGKSMKSIRSRTASRVEYHEDLKPSLKQGLTRNLCLMALVILMGNSFLFGWNIGVLNQPAALIRELIRHTLRGLAPLWMTTPSRSCGL